MDILTDRTMGDMPTDAYKAHLRGLSDTALREETIAAVTEANALRMESCRQQWETLGRASEFLWCYNLAVDTSRA